MWYPVNKGDQNSHNSISDETMLDAFESGLDNGWTVERNEDGTVSAFKNGRYIRDYRHEPNVYKLPNGDPDFDAYDPFDGTDK